MNMPLKALKNDCQLQMVDQKLKSSDISLLNGEFKHTLSSTRPKPLQGLSHEIVLKNLIKIYRTRAI
jgi:hypothetical protein